MGGVKVVGPLCKNGHRYKNGFVSLRYASTRQCVKCHRVWTKLYQKIERVKAKNRETAKAYYYKNRHTDKLRIRRARYEKTISFKASVNRSRLKHREKRLEGTRRWRAENKPHVAAYDKNYRNTEKGKAVTTALRHKRRKARFVVYSAEELQSRFRRLGNKKCLYCRKATRVVVDHLVPLSIGGVDCVLNLVPSCRRCNNLKYNEYPTVWARRFPINVRRRISRLLKAYIKFVNRIKL